MSRGEGGEQLLNLRLNFGSRTGSGREGEKGVNSFGGGGRVHNLRLSIGSRSGRRIWQRKGWGGGVGGGGGGIISG
jgi:hypothetical protein